MPAPIALIQLHLETPFLDETAAFYVEAFGLREGTKTPDQIELTTLPDTEPCLVLSRGDESRLACITFAMESDEALRSVRDAMAARDVEIVEHNAHQLLIRDPDGTMLCFTPGEDISRSPPEGHGRPLYLSHLVLNSRDPGQLVEFYRNVVGLEISDRYENDQLTFMRCNQPQHHCLGIAPGGIDGLNHFAMDCGDIDALMRSVTRMRKAGHEPIWGPGRHGPGGNVFCYFEDPAGFVPEFTCEVLQIDDPATWNPKVWPRSPENANVWLSGGPTPRAIELMSGGADARTIDPSG